MDTFNDTSQYLDDIFTIDYHGLEDHIPDEYPTELHLNKANTSDFSWIYLLFPIVKFPWLSGDVPKLQLYCIYI